MPKWLNPYSSQGIILFVQDVIAFYVIIEIVHEVRLGYRIIEYTPALLAVIGSVIGITVVGLYLANLYHVDRRNRPYELAVKAFFSIVVTGSIIAAILYIIKLTDQYSVLWRGNLLAALAIFALWAAFVRYIVLVAVTKYTREPKWLVIGNGNQKRRLMEDHSRENLTGQLAFLPVEEKGFNDLTLKYECGNAHAALAGDTLFNGEISGIVIAADDALPNRLVTQLMGIRLRGIPIIESTDYYEQYLLRVPVLQLGERWFAMSEGFKLVHSSLGVKIKRIIDIIVASGSLILTLPVMLVVAVTLKLSSKGPVLYSQPRCGYQGSNFTLYKFRTMVENAEQKGAQWSVPSDPRVTRVGKWLRKTRLDELPQLWNVFKGDMSFVGPRPERPDFVTVLERKIPYYDLRHLVKPGITGWAQVMYPYGASVDDARRKLDYDLYYLKHYSLYFDLYILLRTLRVVLSRAGV